MKMVYSATGIKCHKAMQKCELHHCILSPLPPVQDSTQMLFPVFQAEGIPKAYLGSLARHWYHQHTQHSIAVGISLKTPSSTFDLDSPPYKPLRAQFYGVGLFHNLMI